MSSDPDELLSPDQSPDQIHCHRHTVTITQSPLPPCRAGEQVTFADLFNAPTLFFFFQLPNDRKKRFCNGAECLWRYVRYVFRKFFTNSLSVEFNVDLRCHVGCNRCVCINMGSTRMRPRVVCQISGNSHVADHRKRPCEGKSIMQTLVKVEFLKSSVSVVSNSCVILVLFWQWKQYW